MGKKYLGRNINVFLIFMLILTVGSVVMISTYYNYRYQIISNSHNDIAKELKNKTTILESTQTELANLKNNYAQTSTDVKKYDELYLGKVTELGSTQEELTQLKSQHKSAQESLLAKTNELQAEQRVSRNLQIDLDDAKDDFADAKRIIRKCQDWIEGDGDSDDKRDCLDY